MINQSQPPDNANEQRYLQKFTKTLGKVIGQQHTFCTYSSNRNVI